MRAHHFREVIVQQPGKIERVGRFRPIAEHHRDGREHLDGDAGAIAFLDPALRVPDVVADLAKKAVADHHSRAAGAIMIHPNESTVAVACVEVGPCARQDMGVKIDFHRKSDE